MSLKHDGGAHAQRRKPSKRALVYSEDDDDDDDDAPVSTAPRTKRARTVDTDESLSPAITPDDDDDMDVDGETSARRSLSAADDSRFLPENAPDHDASFSYKTRADASEKRRKLTVVSASTKKFQVVYSDEEESDSHDPEVDLAEPSNDGSELDTSPKRGGSKVEVGAAKGKAGKAKTGQLKGAKAKGPKEMETDRDKEILMKDERKLVAATASRASSSAAQSQPSELFSNDDPVPCSTMDQPPDASQQAKDPLNQSIPKKRKLPPIKKTRTATGPSGTSTPTSTVQKPGPTPVQELAKPLLPSSEQRKQALTGVRDIDLADSKVYAELFKGAGGNTPRSGLKNAEERRRELDKMRDEARTRRNEEARFTFDLQRQADKIARFEQRLRAENSTVLHPNFLAAKFRDEWELDRRNRRATPKEEGEA